MSKQDGDSGPLEDIPDVDGIIVVPSKQQATAEGEVHAGSSEDDTLFGIDGDLPVCPEVVEATCSVI